MYVNHIFSLRLKRYGSQKKAARMAAEGVQKMSKYVKPVISLDEGMAEGVYAASGATKGTLNVTYYGVWDRWGTNGGKGLAQAS